MNTKYLSFAFAALAATALLAGCAKNTIEKRQANLELSSVSTNETKAVIDGTIFPKDGHIGLFLFKDEAAVSPYGDTGCSNVEYSYSEDNGKWTANPPIVVGGEPGHLYGYYPYNSAVTDIKAIPVSSSLNGDDVMYATKQTVTDETASQTAIKMNHALARVTITVVNKGYTLGAGELSSIKFSSAEASVNGILDATSGMITGTTKADVTLEVPSGKQTITAEGTVYECLLVPSEEESLIQTLDLTLNIDGNDKTTTLSGDTGVTIAQNTKSNVTIALSNTGISVQTVSIEDWSVVEVGGHKVSVTLDKGASGIDKDVWMKAYAEGSNAIIEAFSILGKRITCQLDDDTMASPVEGGNIRGDVSEEIIESEGIEVTKFVIPVETKDVVATVGVWGEGGRKEITVGAHKVKVVYEELEDIEKDVWMTAYTVGDTAKIEAFSREVKPLIIHTADGPAIVPDENGSVSTFSISDITRDITVSMAHAKTREVTVNVAGVDKAPNVKGYVYGTGNPITVIEGRPSYLTAVPGRGYVVDHLEMKGDRYADMELLFIPDDVETIDAYFRYIDMLGGVFSVSDTRKVRFSRGNLWCDGTGDGYSDQNPVIKFWDFEKKQYESTPSNDWGARSISHISHFMFCNDISNSVCLTSYNSLIEAGNYNGPLFTNADETTPNPDFAVNGQQGVWRVLSGGPGGEWEYLIEKRQQANRFAKAKVHGWNGLLIFPDGYSLPSGYSSEGGTGMCKVNDGGVDYPGSDIPEETWSEMETAGVVFLTAAGYRQSTGPEAGNRNAINVNKSAGYKSSSNAPSSSRFPRDFELYFIFNDVDTSASISKFDAEPFRLVTECQ